MNVDIFWDVVSCSPYTNQNTGGTYQLHLHGRKSAEQEASVLATSWKAVSLLG
jgi:hypothetical protein